MSDSDLRQALIGTRRLIGFQEPVDGMLARPMGDNLQGYLVYTPDAHVFVQFATRDERGWPGPEMLELPDSAARNAIGFVANCGTFEVRDGQLVHHMEFGILQRLSGRVETRSVVLEGDRLILGTPRGGQFECQRVPFNDDATSCTTSDSDLRQTLLGTWRLNSFQLDVDGSPINPLGDAPQGYLVYTPDGHVLVQFATSAERNWPGPEVLEMTGGRAHTALGFFAYSSTFEVHDSQAIHHVEFAILPSWNGRVAPRLDALDGDRLMLGTPPTGLLDWHRFTEVT